MLPCTLVQLYLRGGADGMTLCVPVDDPGYHANRFETRVYHPNDASAPSGKKATIIAPAVMSGSTLVRTAFGLPPAFLGIKPLYDAGKVCFVQAAGSLDPTRSHFEQQKNTELGEITSTPNKNGLGWLGRYLDHTAASGDGSLRALAFSTFQIASYNGGNGVTPAYDPQTFDYPGGALLKTHLTSLYGSTPNPVTPGLQADLGAIQKLSTVNWTSSTAGVYPASVLGVQFKKAFQVIRDVPHVEIISLDYDNIAGQRWDTHNDQGVFVGTMANLMTDLASSLNAFLTDVATLTTRTALVLVYTEFGRTLRENDGHGTDHGRGGVSILAGPNVNGGRVLTKPGTTWTNTLDDLQVDIDVRDLQAEAIVKCLGANVAQVFPDSTYAYHDYGLISP